MSNTGSARRIEGFNHLMEGSNHRVEGSAYRIEGSIHQCDDQCDRATQFSSRFNILESSSLLSLSL
jgi:hypothetical protein